MQKAADSDVREGETPFDARVAALVDRIVPGARVTALRRLSGGAMQESWSIAVDRDGGQQERLILRRGKTGAPRHILDAGFPIEAAAIRAAYAAGAPVPEVRHELEIIDGLGEGFVSDHVDGNTFARAIQRDDRFSAARAGFARQCGDILARIHGAPTAGLPPMRKAQAGEMIDFLSRSIATDPVPRPVFAYALRWLRANRSEPLETPALVHGDFRLGNLMVDDDGIRAVLDWEQTHLGDPAEDFGWLCLPPWRFGQVDRPVGGIGALDDLINAYRAAGGVMDRARVHWWSVAGSLRWGVHCREMLDRFHGDDPSVERGMIARRLSENEIDLLTTIAGGPNHA
ncbi:phosphotransferase family protein [Sphingomonas crocodyli]|uniref:Phosphotransferase family protein n=1 Tax=Sphingomonas crocodyli TaxID=1979270 RepID=A0A437M9M9_9SPHN|nr:phosphotransferase family protein [Sphingomonas crocodyli]RVT94214.1 phosphotransferase family protein [Sphingomonas crocodyli]